MNRLYIDFNCFIMMSFLIIIYDIVAMKNRITSPNTIEK